MEVGIDSVSSCERVVLCNCKSVTIGHLFRSNGYSLNISSLVKLSISG